MEEHLRNKLGFYTFSFVVVFLIVAGYIFTDYIINKEDDSVNVDNKQNKVVVNYKIDESKDYFYFTNQFVINDVEDVEIYYQDIIINIKGQENLTETLEKENTSYKNNIKYISDQKLLSDELIKYNYNDLYALNFREYVTHIYKNYASLVVNDYTYSCFDLISFDKTKSYVFDISKGILLTEDELLKEFDTDFEQVKNNVRKYLESKQQVVNELELIKIDDTINSLNKHALYVDKYGKLYISFLVKTSEIDYNEVMEVL